jgi:plasmid stabilization system protein ParE
VKYQVRLTERAEWDIDSVLQWFRDQSAEAAGAKWFARLMAAIDTLESSPERCGLAAESVDIGAEVRELLVGNRRTKYRVLFQIRERTVHVLRVWHSARDSVKKGDLQI